MQFIASFARRAKRLPITWTKNCVTCRALESRWMSSGSTSVVTAVGFRRTTRQSAGTIGYGHVSTRTQKLIFSHKVGKRDWWTGNTFVEDVRNRVKLPVQIATDNLRAYAFHIRQHFGYEGIQLRNRNEGIRRAEAG